MSNFLKYDFDTSLKHRLKSMTYEDRESFLQAQKKCKKRRKIKKVMRDKKINRSKRVF